jgi:transposase
MGNGSGVSRGDRNRNARLARLRVLVPATNAIVGIDLADNKQMVVVTDHDSKVLARKTFRCRAWDLGAALDWAGKQASSKDFAGVTVACEPTGHRWRVLGQLAGERGMPFVCVQPMLTSWARRSEDLTFDKTDEKDAVIIARLAAQLRCYVPEPVDETWGRLRHLGARREQLLVEAGSQVQQMRALLECVWPAALQTARQPFRSSTWTAAMSVVLDRDGGDLTRTRRLGVARLESAVRREIIRRGKQKPCMRIVRGLFAALTDPAGVITHRPGAFERVALLLDDWLATHRRLLDTETRMTTVLDQLRLTELATSITGLSAIGAAAILAETGDPNRFATARAVVKHAGLAPREKLSGTFIAPHETDRARTARTAAGGVASGLGRATRQPGLRRPVHPPDQQTAQQTHRPPSPGRDRRSDPAAPARRHHHRPTLGPDRRHPWHQTFRGDAHRRLTAADGPSSRVGASPTRH